MGLVIIDSKVEASVQRFFEKLEKYYPEHKVFAFDSIDKNLRETMASLVKKTGCSSAQEFLEAYGYEIITTHEVKKIRNKVIYTPGNEPEIVKNKVDNLIAKLWEYYPDGVVTKLQAQHKNVSKSLSGLYQWLGYESNAKMLEAYGFKSESKESGERPSNDYRALIDELLKRYENKKKVETVGLLLHENQDMASNIKTLQNKANELFGKTLAAYFKEIGLLKEVVKEEKVVVEKVYHYLEVEVEDTIVYCATNSKTIKVGDYVEMVSLFDQNQKIGKVVKTCYFTLEKDLPCATREMQQLIRKLLKSETKAYLASKVEYIYCLVKLNNNDNKLLYYISPFENIEVNDVVKVPFSYYGNYTGVVKTVERYHEAEVPFPLKRTKKIQEIVYSVASENRYKVDEVNSLLNMCKTTLFVKGNEDPHALDTITYFASAVFRGMNDVVYKAIRDIHPDAISISSYIEHVAPGISQFECKSSKVLAILTKYPTLKAVFFAECWRDTNVYLAYSESGYENITSMRFLDTCDFYMKDRWTLMKDPCEYMEEEKDMWEACDYVRENMRYVSDQVIESKPYPKTSMFAPCEIIKL